MKTLPLPLRKTVVERFWAKVEKTPGCWNWTGAKNPKGYGMVTFYNLGGVAKSGFPAHRVAYQLHHGHIASDALLDHLCYNRACVNPDHLRPVTNKQNGENRQGAQVRNVSGARGVTWDADAGKWRARVMHHDKAIHVGRFDDLEEAKVAAIRKRLELYTHNEMDKRSCAA